MKLIFLLHLYLLTNTNIIGQVLLDLINNNIHGKVKEEIIFTYKTIEKGGKLKKDFLLWKTISKYNEKGNKTEYLSYFMGDSNSIQDHYKFKYNEKDELTICEIWSFEFLVGKDTFKYDNLGRIIEVCEITMNGSFGGKTIYEYLDSNVVYKIKYDENTNIKYKSYYKFDNENKPVQYCFDIKNDTLKNLYMYYYDLKSNLNKTGTLDENNKLKDITTYKYEKFDINDNWLYQIEYCISSNIIERVILYY